MRFPVVNIDSNHSMGGMVEDLQRSWQEARERFAEQERARRQREADRPPSASDVWRENKQQIDSLCEIGERMGGLWEGKHGQIQMDAVENVLSNVPSNRRPQVESWARRVCPEYDKLAEDITAFRRETRKPPDIPTPPIGPQECFACGPGDFQMLTASQAMDAGCTKTLPGNCGPEVPTVWPYGPREQPPVMPPIPTRAPVTSIPSVPPPAPAPTAQLAPTPTQAIQATSAPPGMFTAEPAATQPTRLQQQIASAPFSRGLQAVGGFGGLLGPGIAAGAMGTMPTGGMATGALAALPNWVMAGRQVPLQVRRDSIGFGRLW